MVALPPPAHQAIHPITFIHNVPEYTAEERGRWRRGEKRKRRGRAVTDFATLGRMHLLHKQAFLQHKVRPRMWKKTHSSTACRLCALTAGVVQEFPLQCCGKSRALFSRTEAGEESYSPDLKQEERCHLNIVRLIILHFSILQHA